MMLSKGLLKVVAILAAVLAFGALARGADLADIKARGELLHLGIRYANFVTGAGNGFDVELVKGFAHHIGVRYRLIYTDFYNVVPDLLGHKVVRQGNQANLGEPVPVRGDMISTGFTVLPWRESILLFSAPVFPSQVLLVARSDAPERPIRQGKSIDEDIARTRALIGKKSLLVMEGTCLDPAAYGLKGIGIDLRAYNRSTNLNEMVPAMLNREAHFTLLDVPDALLDLRKWQGKIKVLGPVSHEQTLAAAFPRNATALRDEFDAYLRRIRQDGTYDRLVDKYYPGIRSYFPEFFARKG